MTKKEFKKIIEEVEVMIQANKVMVNRLYNDADLDVSDIIELLDDRTGEDIIEWFTDWCEFDVSDYVFTLHGVYNIEFLLNVFEELVGILNHTIEVKAGVSDGT